MGRVDHQAAVRMSGGDGDFGGFYGGGEAMEGVEEVAQVKHGNENGYGGGYKAVQSARTSELTISFEGEVYVFPAVTPQKGGKVPKQ
ncbi:hypothetical protein Tsubulata_044947, partial [Turnera subulata]